MPRYEPDDLQQTTGIGYSTHKVAKLRSPWTPSTLLRAGSRGRASLHVGTRFRRSQNVGQRCTPPGMTTSETAAECPSHANSKPHKPLRTDLAHSIGFLAAERPHQNSTRARSCARHTGLPDRSVRPHTRIVVNKFTRPTVRCCWKLDGGRTAVSMTGWQGVPLEWAAVDGLGPWERKCLRRFPAVQCARSHLRIERGSRPVARSVLGRGRPQS